MNLKTIILRVGIVNIEASSRGVKTVNPESQRQQSLFGSDHEIGEGLWNYVQTLTPETIAQLSKPESQEVFQVMERNIIGLLGNLPSEHFGITVSTSREHLGRLLASAMMSGYFLRNAEQRMGFEQSFHSLQGVSDTE
jgi:hypothetical protein